MTDLAKCGCGKVPTELLYGVSISQDKSFLVLGNCCNFWGFTVTGDFDDFDNEQLENLWNGAPRVQE